MRLFRASEVKKRKLNKKGDIIMTNAMKLINETKVIAIVRGIKSQYIVDMAKAMQKGGIKCIEVTFSPKSEEASLDTLKSISLLKKEFGDTMAIGAGTVLTPENVVRAKEAGAEYIISPNTDEAVIKKTKELGLISIPGSMTPTEAVNAYNWGADIVKLFPAAALGVGYIKALMGPLNHIPFTAVGGVNAKNMKDFIDIGCVGIGVGGNLVNKELIEAGDWEAITKYAAEYFE